MTTVSLSPITPRRGLQSSSTSSPAEMFSGHSLTVTSAERIGWSLYESPYQAIGDITYLGFDLSSIPAIAIVSDATLKVKFSSIGADGIIGVDAREYDWGASVDSTDWAPAFNGTRKALLTGKITSVNTTLSLDDYGLTTLVAGKLGQAVKLAVSSQTLFEKIGPSGYFSQWGEVSSWVLDVTYTIPAPILTSCNPVRTLPAGGGTITLGGFNFDTPGAGTTTVTFGSNPASDVEVVDNNTITCTIPAGTAGRVVITVTNNHGSSGYSIFFYYIDVKDYSVKFVKAGSVAGNEMADTGTYWPLVDTYASYGSADSLQGLTLTPADVNGSGFGLAISAALGPYAEARPDYADITVFYETPDGTGEASYLIGLKVDNDGSTTTPEAYKLPRAGFTVAQDVQVDKAQSDATFFTSRYYAPSRAVKKTHRAVEAWFTLTPQSNTPGVQVWASVDDGAFFQLLDGDGNPATVTETGFARLFFPATDASVGTYVQLKLVVPPLESGQVPVAVSVADMALRLSLRPSKTEVTQARLVLGAGEFQDATSMRATALRQLAVLEGLLGPDATPEPFHDPVTNQDGYMELIGMEVYEASMPGLSESVLIADVMLRRTYYGG